VAAARGGGGYYSGARRYNWNKRTRCAAAARSLDVPVTSDRPPNKQPLHRSTAV